MSRTTISVRRKASLPRCQPSLSDALCNPSENIRVRAQNSQKPGAPGFITPAVLRFDVFNVTCCSGNEKLVYINNRHSFSLLQTLSAE